MRSSAAITNPNDAAEIFRARYDAAVASYSSGHDSPDLFRANLKQLGFAPREIGAEVSLHEPQRLQSLGEVIAAVAEKVRPITRSPEMAADLRLASRIAMNLAAVIGHNRIRAAGEKRNDVAELAKQAINAVERAQQLLNLAGDVADDVFRPME